MKLLKTKRATALAVALIGAAILGGVILVATTKPRNKLRTFA